MNPPALSFEFKEDESYLDELFSAVGGLNTNAMHFDFGNPVAKRKAFSKIRDREMERLKSIHGDVCQLCMHPDCAAIAQEVDHLIPLSTNVLNKQLRHMVGIGGRKVPAQSFGSNHPDNLVLACSRCNAFKKHRLPSSEQLNRIKRRLQ